MIGVATGYAEAHDGHRHPGGGNQTQGWDGQEEHSADVEVQNGYSGSRDVSQDGRLGAGPRVRLDASPGASLGLD